MNNKQILEEVHRTFNHATATRDLYKQSVKKYTDYFNMSLDDLIKEAEAEEDEGIRWKRRTLKRRLINYRQYLLENHCINTVNTLMRPIFVIYKYFEIEIHELPKLNRKQAIKPEPISFKDLPDKEIIREAISISNPLMKAIILFMCSSGCAMRESLNLTVQNYIDALSEYSKKKDIYSILEDLKDNEDIVPTFNVRRQKTDKYYVTYCSPEAVSAINSYLLSREDELKPDTKLFKINRNYLVRKFMRINEDLSLGKKGNFNRFRSHMLRKFHASALYNDGMSRDNVNDLQGKAKNKTDDAYFMTNPEDLKYEYIKHLPAVTINQEVEKLSIKSPEFIQIENEKNQLMSELTIIKSEMGDIKKMRKELENLKAQMGK